ncbi:dTDP-4-dehydrorhamnose reductase [Cytobacillus oceanisediminis]|uniref:dTDP-4-dehydrorhamnose reductase n=1 Tax=Cytobacillus oceanisediminis TaxID=665099 RepID=UPI003736A743
MDILITGGEGQLGKELKKKLSECHSVHSLGKGELEITNKEQADFVISNIKPHIIIHAAAFTAVDKCEKEMKKAYEVNSIGTGYIAQAGKKVNSKIFYISTDYVFDGTKRFPYCEKDNPIPISVYGMSKWLGEKLVLTYSDATVIRTSWLYGHYGKNFVKTMLDLGNRNKIIKVVNDQTGSPTYVNDLTDTIIQLLEKKSGIYHVSNSGSCTWYEFAKAIFEKAGYDPKRIFPVSTKEYGAHAKRPCYSVLDNQALLKEGIKPLRNWNEALVEFIRKETKS